MVLAQKLWAEAAKCGLLLKTTRNSESERVKSIVNDTVWGLPVGRIRFSNKIPICIDIITNNEIIESSYFNIEIQFSRIINWDRSNEKKSSIEFALLVSDMASD